MPSGRKAGTCSSKNNNSKRKLTTSYADKKKKKPDFVSYEGSLEGQVYSGIWCYNVATVKSNTKFSFKMRDAKNVFHPACREKSMVLDYVTSRSDVRNRSPIFLGYSSKNCEVNQEGLPSSTTLFEGYFEMTVKKNATPVKIDEFFYASLDSSTTIKGKGANRFGNFLLTGTYDAKSKLLSFRKTYQRRPSLKRSPVTRRVQATIRKKKISGVEEKNIITTTISDGLMPPSSMGRRRSSGRKRTSSSLYARDLGYVSEEDKRRAKHHRKNNEKVVAVAAPVEPARLTRRRSSTIKLEDLNENMLKHSCDICDGNEDSSQWGKLLRCSLCGVCVHSVCYGVQGNEISVLSLGKSKWMCSWCTKSGISANDQSVCVLCPHQGGALKETTDGRWVHLSCALWSPECAFVNSNRMEPVGCFDSKKVTGFHNFPHSKFQFEKCVICKMRGGSLLRCTSEIGCKSMMHPRCIRRHRLAMQASVDKRRFKFKLCCPTHANKSNKRSNNRSSSIEMETFSESEGWMDATVLATGDIYEGEMKRHRPHGRGTCIRMSSGHMYEGQWKSGRWHGQGILTDASDRVIYEGEWADSQPHGYGILHFRGGSWYEGEFLQGTFHGKGTFVDGTGGWYSGEWRQGRRHGRGKYVKWPSIYEGGWNEDDRDGRGVLWRSDGLHYEGNFKANMMDGRGTITYPDGSRYVGTWKRGLREGRGTITFANQSTYEGHFREDKFDMSGNTGTFTLAKIIKRDSMGERIIPINMGQDLSRIHLRAGFTEHGT